ncbi:dTDP-4-dehydrorhamnose reductase [Roseibium alexandrii]|uniref:dTDP-4-dehydrorhamnose reductase n=1 Tax=Roseibium alexandrii TaxID=388408 RepID=A0A0M7AKK7_9HYPH|nr:dTDP-4-dehydrorhamnose reductase [Roseibium alexandrii]CTQ75419.1 dTDP-4-dehydrorhamnose reductase [Roseibium alexandrii]
MTRILITGGTGQVGGALGKLSWPDGTELVLPSRAELDLDNADQIGSYVRYGGFDAIISSGAYTAVDKAEDDLLTAFKVNGLAPAAFAEAAKELDIPLVHISTDYVFDGGKTGRYVETDPIDPQGVYGASKAAGELAIQSSGCRHVILRTAWVFSAIGANFVKTMIRLADRPQLTVVDDQTGCPTAAPDIARAAQTIVLRQLTDKDAPSGVYHYCGYAAVTWFGFASEIFRHLEARGLAVPAVAPIPTRDYPTPAKRPANSALDTSRLTQDFGIEPCQWRAALASTVEELMGDKEKGLS